MQTPRTVRLLCLTIASLLAACGDEAPTGTEGVLSIQKAPTNSGDGQTDTVLATLASPFRVLVSRGNAPARDVTVLWTAQGDSSSATVTTFTNASGIAEFRKTLGRRAGAYQSEASVSVPDAIGSPVTFTATANPGKPTLRYVSGNNQTDTTNARLSADYIVRVTDSYDNAVAGVVIDWAVTAGGGSITPTRSTTQVGSGNASARHTLGPDDGAQTVTAKASGLAGAPQQTFTATAFTLGSLQVTAATTGVDLDPNGYTVLVDEVCDPYSGCVAGWGGTVGVNGVVTTAGLRAGEHTVRLGDVAENCTVAGANPRTVTVQGGVAPVSFAITCVALGSIQVTAATTGAELPDGHAVVIRRSEFGQSTSVPTNGTATMAGLPPGDYEVILVVAENCTVAGANPRTVTVEAGGVAAVSFSITCVARGSLQVTAATSGVELDPNGYSAWARRPGFGKITSVPSNGTATISGLPAGDYSVTLDDVAGNCTVAGGNPRTVTVQGGEVASVSFAITCVALGSVQVTAATTGVDLDPNGYTVVAQRSVSRYGTSVPTNGTATMSGLPPGDYNVTLDGASANCDVVGPNPRTVSVPAGATAAVTFDVACAQASQLAVVVSGNIYVVKSNGDGLTPLTTDAASPAWSPDGSRIVFLSARDGNHEIYVMNADGTNPMRLTTDPGADIDPGWSPDGTKIVFASSRVGNYEIYVMDAEGTNLMRLTNNTSADLNPAWSPDGTQIAFTSSRDGNGEIYVMNPDGSGVTRLTNNAVDDLQPAWSPDGTKLVFSRFTGCDYYSSFCDDDLFVMNADGSGAAQLTSSSSDNDPAWSPDGRWIAFGATFCDSYGWYGECLSSHSEVWLVRADGTRHDQLLTNAFHPAWRP